MPHFCENPEIPLLQWLARSSLKQNLLRSLRLWVLLRLLYADPDDLSSDPPSPGPLSLEALPDPFTFADWRTAFFSPSHPSDEKTPLLHDPTCACARTAHDWILGLVPNLDLSYWKASLHRHDSLPEPLDTWLHQRLFGITRRSLDEDLRILCKLGWLHRQGTHYQRVQTFPSFPGNVQMEEAQPLLHPDLAAIARTLSPVINGHPRFFLHVDYVVPNQATDRVDDWQAKLRQIWEQTPIPPIQLTFYSAKADQVCNSIVYPVCVYYAQRGPYLCAWGQVHHPDDKVNNSKVNASLNQTKTDLEIDWRNYRLDRIHAIHPLNWQDSNLPKPLRRAFQCTALPTPDNIQERMAQAWGFDFYQPAETLLLRFNSEFAKRYIHNSLRHETFCPVTVNRAKALIRAQVTDASVQQHLLRVIQTRSPQDAYYTAQYRRHDLNILLRLRAWRPAMEVLLPWGLRQQMAIEVQQEFQFYQGMIQDDGISSNSSKI